MSTNDVNAEDNANKAVDWSTLSEHCKAEIKANQQKIKTLSKSLFFFDKQAASGADFPLKKGSRHDELS
jgi:hypothetical protein